MARTAIPGRKAVAQQEECAEKEEKATGVHRRGDSKQAPQRFNAALSGAGSGSKRATRHLQ